MDHAEQRFRRLAFLQTLLGLLAFCIAAGQPVLLLAVGLSCVAAWFVTETRGSKGGLPRVMLNVGALLAVALVLMEFKVTGGGQPVVLVGHLTLALQVLLLFGQRGRREFAQLAVLSPLQMISASVLPGGVTLIYAMMLMVYCLLTLMTAVAAQIKRTGDRVHDQHKRATRDMDWADVHRPDAVAGPYQRLQVRVTTVALGLLCALVAAALFLTAPRSERSDFASTLTRPAASSQTGYSTTVTLNGGSIGEGSPEPVLNLSIQVAGVDDAGGGDAWLVRGAALDQYHPDDREWARSPYQSRFDLTLHKADQGITLANLNTGLTAQADITLRRTSEQTIFTPARADAPVALARIHTPSLPRVILGTRDQQIVAGSPMNSVHTYYTTVWVQAPPPAAFRYDDMIRTRSGAPDEPRPRRLRGGPRPLGENVPWTDPTLIWTPEHDAVRRLAMRILAPHGLDQDHRESTPERRLQAARVLADALRLRYRYTTDNPPTGERDPVAAFLFDQRAGHCELFASGLCALCRTVGIPARIVTGFRASEYNDIGEYYIVRQSHAHAWTEVHLGTDAGWHTLDATPPAEVDRQHQQQAGWTAGLRELYDHYEFRWISSVITYDEHAQQNLLGGAGAWITQGPDQWAEGFTDWADRQADEFEIDTVGYLSLGLIAVALVIAVFSLARLLILRHRRMVALQLTALPRAQRRGLARQLRFYITMLESLERHGHVRPHWQSPYGFAEALAQDDPMRFDPVVALTELFYEVRFGYRHLDDDRRARVKAHLKHLEQSLAGPGK